VSNTVSKHLLFSPNIAGNLVLIGLGCSKLGRSSVEARSRRQLASLIDLSSVEA